MVDVYVRDQHRLGVKKWFERENPHALAQIMERMLEAARQGYWQADAATVQELKQRHRDLAKRFDVRSDNSRFTAFAGYGLTTAAMAVRAALPIHRPRPTTITPPVRVPARIEGQRLTRVAPRTPDPLPLSLGAALLLMATSLAGGMVSAAGDRRYAPYRA